MPDPLIALLIGTSLASLVAYLFWTRRQQVHRSRQVKEVGAYCVWCLYRHGDICIHPGSPVYLEECGPVCTGLKQCEVRLEQLR